MWIVYAGIGILALIVIGMVMLGIIRASIDEDQIKRMK
jgi:hypothetical protein